MLITLYLVIGIACMCPVIIHPFDKLTCHRISLGRIRLSLAWSDFRCINLFSSNSFLPLSGVTSSPHSDFWAETWYGPLSLQR